MLGSPVVLFDKSAFQRLTRTDALTVASLFSQLFPPILAIEVMGDLAKTLPPGRSPDECVAAIARKFVGSGPPLVWDCGTMCMTHLLGGSIGLTFGLPVMNATRIPTEDGGFGIMIEPSQTNLDLMRWSEGTYRDDERGAAQAWRGGAKGFRIAPLERVFNEKHVVVPKPASIADCAAAADRLLGESDLRQALVEYLLDEIGPTPDLRRAALARIQARRDPLARVSPYAHFCLRVVLTYYIARRFTLVRTDPNDEADLQYLNYGIYCDVFVSADTLQLRLAPALLPRRATIVKLEDLQQDIRKRHDEWEGLDESARERRARAFGGYPIPMEGSIITALYDKYVGRWPGGGNSAVELSPDELARAMNEAHAMWRAHTARGRS